MSDPTREVSISATRIRLISEMQAKRIIEARDHIAQAAYAAMNRVEAEAALRASSRAPRERLVGLELLLDPREALEPGSLGISLGGGPAAHELLAG
jgi:hypothetical protein